MFRPIGTLIRTAPARGGSSTVILALRVRQVASRCLTALCADLPAEVLGRVKIVSFKSGVLTIKASSLLSAELQARSGGLISEINKVLGGKIVNRIRFRVP